MSQLQVSRKLQTWLKDLVVKQIKKKKRREKKLDFVPNTGSL
jgi:hypothetical protein